MLQSTNFQFPYMTRKYSGKVRDVYLIEESLLVLVATDRVSAFDTILPQPIPHKGQLLNQLSAIQLAESQAFCPNHFLEAPDPNVTIGIRCEPYPVEFIVRGYLSGHAWRLYKNGERVICGNQLPDGLTEHAPLPTPILTPSTKSKIGPDIDLTDLEITKSGLIPSDEYLHLKNMALALYQEGQQRAAAAGLLMLDSKYEFGQKDFRFYLIDELHTPDSSRFFELTAYQEYLEGGSKPYPLSKEFLREWLMRHDFMGEPDKQPPDLTNDFINQFMNNYTRVFAALTNSDFKPETTVADTETRMYENILAALKRHLG